jgi:hypothetical protein
MRGKTPGSVMSCGDLVDAGVTAVGGKLEVGGAQPGCVADGLLCPLARLGLDMGVCDAGGELEARCVQSRWQLECYVDDAGGGDAAGDGPGDASSDQTADAPTHDAQSDGALGSRD